MDTAALRDLFVRIEPPLREPDESSPPILATFAKLGLPLSAVASAIGVSHVAASQWRSRVRPIPRVRQIEMLAILVLLQRRFEQLMVKAGFPGHVREGLLRDAATIQGLLKREFGRRRAGAQLEKFATDLESEVRRVADTLEPKLRSMWSEADQRRQRDLAQ